jgi:hypothetical protein
MPFRPIAVALLLALPLCLRAAAPAAESSEALGDQLSLLNGLALYTPPPEEQGWELHRTVRNTQNAVRGARYILRGQATLQVELNPSAAPKGEAHGKYLRDSMVQDLKAMYRKMAAARNSRIEELITDAKVLDDPRFFLAVESTYREAGHEHACLRLFHNLPPHQLMITLVTRTQDKEAAQQARDAAEQVALSGQLSPRGAKAPPPPDAPPLGKSPGKTGGDEPPPSTPQLQEAQKALAEATARVEAELLNRPDYAKAKSAADEAEARLKELRAKEPPDRAAITRASTAWLDARRPLARLRREALDKDPQVIEARKNLAAARKESSGR